MEKKESKFINFIKEAFGNKKKRPIATLVVILPFLIIIGICGLQIYKQAKDLIGVIGESGTEALNNNYQINGNDYVLRDTATDVQKEYFAELKDYIENGTGTPEDKAGSIVKNFVADFYTFSNKLGQYDVGGMYYVYTQQRKTIYIQARDQFYQYINKYINEYGTEALLEVENVNVTVTDAPSGSLYSVIEINEETGEEYTAQYNYFLVEANWNYVSKEGGFSTSSYDTKGNFVVIDHAGRYEIAYAGKEVYSNSEE